MDISSVPRADMAALAEAVTYVAHLDSVRGDVECVLGCGAADNFTSVKIKTATVTFMLVNLTAASQRHAGQYQVPDVVLGQDGARHGSDAKSSQCNIMLSTYL